MEVNSILFSSIFVIASAYFLRQIMKIYNTRKKLSKIGGMKSYPLIGSALEFAIPHEELIPFVHFWVEKYKNRNIFKVFIFHKTYIVLFKGRILESILNSSRHISKAYDYRFLESWLGTGLLTSDGDKWHTRRKMLTPAFHFKILEDFISIFNEQSMILVDKLRKNTKESFNIFPYITRCTLDIICDSAMGRNVNAQGEKDSEYVKAVNSISVLIHYRQLRPWLWPDWIFNLHPMGRKHKIFLEILHGFTNKVIQDKKAERNMKQASSFKPVKEDVMGKKKRLAFLDLLLEASDGGQKLSNEDLREEVDTFMFEGHDTTAAGISWALYLLGHHPEFQTRVQEELEAVIGSGEDCIVTSEHLKELKYLECVIKESLRLYPPVPVFGRRLKEAVNIDGHEIPAGFTVGIIPYFIHRNDDVFPKPEEFRPERFQEGNENNRGPYDYIPFSAGPRNCIGQKFALMEEKIILAHILHSFNIKSVVPREEIKPLMELVLRPKDGIIVNLTPRRIYKNSL